MTVVEGLISVVLIVAIVIMILGYIGTRFGVTELKEENKKKDELIVNLNNQILELHKKLRKKRNKKKETNSKSKSGGKKDVKGKSKKNHK